VVGWVVVKAVGAPNQFAPQEQCNADVMLLQYTPTELKEYHLIQSRHAVLIFHQSF